MHLSGHRPPGPAAKADAKTAPRRQGPLRPAATSHPTGTLRAASTLAAKASYDYTDGPRKKQEEIGKNAESSGEIQMGVAFLKISDIITADNKPTRIIFLNEVLLCP